MDEKYQNPGLFSPGKIGPLTLRNRAIRAAAFEGMCKGHNPSPELLEYHRSVATGGIGMTTVAYASVNRSGLSFSHQMWLRSEILPALRNLTDAVHKQGAAVSIQVGHCGLMAKRSLAGGRPLAPTGRFNLYGPTFPRTMQEHEILDTIKSFGEAVKLCRDAGFDAVEIHAGHGYLVSQFLSPYSNHRKDQWGGSFENRTRFLKAVMKEVKDAVPGMAVLVKMNLRDGFEGGMQLDEATEVAKILENHGADALILSGGFTSRSPMYVMRGSMPLYVMARYIRNPFMKAGIRLFGNLLIKPEPFHEGYFLKDALQIRKTVNLPLVYVGGLTSLAKINEVLSKGFEFVSFARALINDPGFINKLKTGETDHSECNHSNYCIAVMYSGQMACYQHEQNLPSKWRKKLDRS
jgi:2,4-dienoyl-CoA reductase-like NADH-dependent reductase (Old Yellow Enzyme family)